MSVEYKIVKYKNIVVVGGFEGCKILSDKNKNNKNRKDIVMFKLSSLRNEARLKKNSAFI